MTRRTTLAVRLAATVLLLAAVGEITLRAAYKARFGTWTRQPPLFVNTGGDFYPNPGADVVFHTVVGHPISGETTAQIRYRINDFGLRGPQTTLERRTPVRILCLGGSTAFGWTATQGSEWPRRLDSELRSTLGTGGIEVLNAGANGLSHDSIRKAWAARWRNFQPTHVVYLFGYNDFDAWRHLGVMPDNDLPWNSARPMPLERLTTHPSLLYAMLSEKIHGRNFIWEPVGWLEGSEEFDRPEPRKPLSSWDTDSSAFLRSTVAALARFDGEISRAGARLIVVPFVTAIDAEGLGDSECAWRHSAGLNVDPAIDWRVERAIMNQIRETVRSEAAQTGVQIFEPESDRLASRVHWSDLVHFSHAGEEEFARQLAEKLRGDLAQNSR